MPIGDVFVRGFVQLFLSETVHGEERGASRSPFRKETLFVMRNGRIILPTSTFQMRRYLFIDETEKSVGPQTMCGIALIQLESPEEATANISNLHQSLLRDPAFQYLPNKDKLARVGFHHVDDPLEFRVRFIDFLAGYPFRAYLAFKVVSPPESIITSAYELLLTRVLEGRLIKKDLVSVEIVIEECLAVQQATMVGTIRPGIPADRRVIITPKTGNLCLCIADYVLNVFADYWLNPAPPSSKEARNFLRIEPKIRLIYGANTDRFHTDRNPLKKP
jgi:hypothetical protein